MNFPISGQHISPVYLIAVGFIIGVFGGFFGVGGSFLAGPALFIAGMPMNFVVGTDLAHIVGKSIVAARKHQALGNVDMKLAWIMVIGTVIGSELGAQGIQMLKHTGKVDFTVGIVFVIVLVSVSVFMMWETARTLRSQAGRPKDSAGKDQSAVGHIATAMQRIRLAPIVELPTSGIRSISFWIILFVSFIGGLFSGFLGGGAGYIRMPMMVYLLGVPTHVAVGTDLFEVMISASYGTFTHALKGNVDIMVALVMHTGAAIGAQIGAFATQYFSGPKIRLAFIPLPLIGVGLIIYRLLGMSAT
jgi:uncharacterized membrane protein YfcA